MIHTDLQIIRSLKKAEKEKNKRKPPYLPGRPTEHKQSDPSKNRPPRAPGEYRIYDKDRMIKYIGETNNLERREREHKRSGKLQDNDIFAWQTASKDSNSDTRRDHERKKIKQHKPSLNKSRGGEGRKASDMEKPKSRGFVSRLFAR